MALVEGGRRKLKHWSLSLWMLVDDVCEWNESSRGIGQLYLDPITLRLGAGKRNLLEVGAAIRDETISASSRGRSREVL